MACQVRERHTSREQRVGQRTSSMRTRAITPVLWLADACDASGAGMA